MRHRDPKQTAKTYTDARMLPLKEAIAKLTFHRVEASGAGDTQIDTQTPVAAGHLVSTSVTLPMLAESEKIARFTREKVLLVTPSPDGSKAGKWSERQDLNLRRLGPKRKACRFHRFTPGFVGPHGRIISR
jgi:hypothetical protein